VAREVGDLEGWVAVGAVAGLGLVMLLGAAALAWRARSPRDRPAVVASYRTAARPGSADASYTRGLAWLLLGLCALTQLVYLGLYVEVVAWLAQAGPPPRIDATVYFWVLLVDGSCTGGALGDGLRREA
jgi:hypothetical protein